MCPTAWDPSTSNLMFLKEQNSAIDFNGWILPVSLHTWLMQINEVSLLTILVSTSCERYSISFKGKTLVCFLCLWVAYQMESWTSSAMSILPCGNLNLWPSIMVLFASVAEEHNRRWPSLKSNRLQNRIFNSSSFRLASFPEEWIEEGLAGYSNEYSLNCSNASS